MIYTDERFKDASPESTVDRIKNILNKNGLEIIETLHETGLTHCHALTLTIKGTTLFSNGKGVTAELARASAYGELMERLQSGNLGIGKSQFSDRVIFSKDDIISHCGDYLDKVAKGHPKNDGSIASVDDLAELCLLMDNGDSAYAIPFYNLTDDKMTYYPQEFLKIYSANGLSAGNTTEEALVQSLSEIFERHCMLTILKESIVPPSIPDEYLSKFSRAYETIKAVREAGYDIYIKDCSLEMPFPVLASVIIDKHTHSYHVHLGCHPIFEIALGRTLTETFQGRNLFNVAAVSDLAQTQSVTSTNANLVKSLTRSIGAYPTEFFGNEFSYEFKGFKDRTSLGNKELLGEFIKYIESMGYKILVRDHSCLGFNSYRIVIPGMSETNFSFLETGNSLYAAVQACAAEPCDYVNITPRAAKYRAEAETYMFKLTGIPRMSSRFFAPLTLPGKEYYTLYNLNMAFLEYAAGSFENAAAYLNKTIAVNPGYDTEYLHCLRNQLSLVINGKSQEEAIAALAPFYLQGTLDELSAAIKDGNPFRKYAYNCAPEYCDSCKYKNCCLDKTHREVKAKVNEAYKHFDNDAAFSKLKTTLSAIR